MRFVAGRGAEAESDLEDVAGRGAVAKSDPEDVAGRGSHREELDGKSAQKPRFCAREASLGSQSAGSQSARKPVPLNSKPQKAKADYFSSSIIASAILRDAPPPPRSWWTLS